MTSNVYLGVVPTHADHPISELLRRGVDVTVNTDDPAFFSTTLDDELLLLHRHHGVGVEGLRALQLRAEEASFAPVSTKAQLVRDIIDHVAG